MQKGFTLFTALVAFALIVLTVLLMHSMTKTETDKSTTISEVEEQAEMEAIANLVRADALNSFMYLTRYWIEDALNCPDPNDIEGTCVIGAFPLEDLQSWDKTKENFQNQFVSVERACTQDEITQRNCACDPERAANDLGYKTENCVKGAGSQYAFFLSGQLSELIKTETQSGYNISLASGVSDQAKLIEVIQSLITQGATRKDLFEVVGCDNGSVNNCNGTFYINLDLTQLSAEDYEKLPRIQIKKSETNRTVQLPILPRQKISIFVPIRYFKVLAEARALAYELNADGSTKLPWGTNHGILGVINHNRIEEMQLGMCDAGICRPRDNPFVKPIFNEISGFNCPNTIAPEAKNIPRVELFCDNYSGICAGLGSSPSYDPNNSTDMGTKLSRMAANIICQEINYMRTNGGFNKAENSDGGTFTTTGNECENIFVLAQAIDSKKIIWQFGDTKSVQQVNRERYEKNACPMTEPYRTYPGLFKDTGGLLSNPKISSAELKCSASDFSSGNNGYSQCEEVSKVEVNITFEESNSKYIVNKQLEKTHYIIKLVDNRFTLFTPNYTSTREPDCLRSETLGHPGCNPAAWTCYSITNQSMPPDDWGCYTSAS